MTGKLARVFSQVSFFEPLEGVKARGGRLDNDESQGHRQYLNHRPTSGLSLIIIYRPVYFLFF